MHEPLTYERLCAVLAYDPATGLFRWLVVNGPRAVVGAIAGSPDRKGYIRIRVDGTKHAAHRLAWLYMTGEWPTELIDHRDRCRANNSFDNIRPATLSQNGANSLYTKRKAGRLKGAYPNKGRWQSCIVVRKQRTFFGTFDTEEEAHAAYCRAAGPAFGEFARLG